QAFLREVDDALQQEKLQFLWESYRVPLVGGIAALLVAVAGWQLWQGAQARQQASVAADWYAAAKISADNSPAKQAMVDSVIANGPDGYRALALFSQARNAPDAAAADKLYAKVYEDKSQPQWVRDLARLNAGMALMGSDNTTAQRHFEELVTYQ